MGNSLPHLLTEEALDAALDRFARLVRPGGAMAAQLLNYEPIIETGRRIVGVARLDDREFIRFYDFLADDLLRFNVLMLRWDGDDCETAIHETPLRPWRADQLAAAIERAGFEPPATYGSLDRGPFDPSTSEGLVLVARRAG
jgi:hypothetical protein